MTIRVLKVIGVLECRVSDLPHSDDRKHSDGI